MLYALPIEFLHSPEFQRVSAASFEPFADTGSNNGPIDRGSTKANGGAPYGLVKLYSKIPLLQIIVQTSVQVRLRMDLTTELYSLPQIRGE